MGFLPAAREVFGTPSFEGYDRYPKPGRSFESALLGLDVAIRLAQDLAVACHAFGSQTERFTPEGVEQ